MRVSDYCAEFLASKGIDRCFSVTGGGAMHLNDSFGVSKSIKVVYNHHEQASAMAAEGYSRVTNRPAIVCVTSGPGAINSLTGVFGAWQDSIPMIVISGQMKSTTLRDSTPGSVRYLGFQEADIVPIASSITKFAVTVKDPSLIGFYLEKAYHLATSGRPGPVWLDIPLDIQGTEITTEVLQASPNYLPVQDFWVGRDAHAEAVKIIELLAKYEKPVLMIGEEIRVAGAQNLVSTLADALKIPIVTEWNAHDLIEDNNQWYCGRPGTIGNRGGNYVVQRADLLIALGCQLSIRQISYEWGNFARDAFRVGISWDADELVKKTVKFDLMVHSGPLEIIAALTNVVAINPMPERNNGWIEWARWINQKYPVALPRYASDSVPLNPYPFFDVLSAYLRNRVVVLANGAACVCGLQATKIQEGTRLFTNAGASSMGYGLAAAVGVASSGVTDATICIEGDGSIMMNLHELQTIVDNNFNVKIFLLNNDGYHSIRQTQKNLFSAEERGYHGANKDSGLGLPDFNKLANAFGYQYTKIDKYSQLKTEIEKTLDHVGPAICEVFIDPYQDFEPKLVSKMDDEGNFSTPSLEYMHPFLSEEELRENEFRPR